MNSLATQPLPSRKQGGATPFPHLLATFAVEEGVGVVRIRRERARQSLNPATVFQLSAAIEMAQRHPLVRGIVIIGSGATFSNGADLNYFIAAIEQGRIDKILKFTQAGNDCFDAIERSAKPVVAALNGSALGGGLELALACGQRIATRGASLAFPETNLGLFPGWGGIWRSRRMLSAGLAKSLIYSGQTLSANDAHAIGFIDAVTTPPQLLAEAKSMALGGSVKPAVAIIPARFDAKSYAAFHETHTVANIFGTRFAAILTPALDVHAALIRSHGLAALQRAEQLFALAESLTPQEFAAANLRLVDEAFQSAEVYRRLKATQPALQAKQ